MKKSSRTFARFRAYLNLENYFVLLVLIAGTFIAVFSLPGDVPDEADHFTRVYAILHGNLVDQSITLPRHTLEVMYNFRKGFINISTYFQNFAEFSDHHELYTYGNKSPYSPAVYIPQLLGMGAGLLLGLTDRWMFQLGRLVSVIFFTGTAYYILKKTPVSKQSLFVLLSMPMAVYLMASYSGDGMMILFTLIYLHLIIAGISSSKAMTRKEWGVFMLVSTLLALTKPISVVLPLLAIAIPADRFKSRRQKLYFVVGQLAVMGIAVLWAVIIMTRPITTTPLGSLPETVQPARQVVYMLGHPLATLTMIFRTFAGNASFYFKSLVGLFGWLTTPLPDFTYYLFSAGLILALLGDLKKPLILSGWQRLTLLAVLILYMAGVVLSFYVLWTPVGAALTEGVQGRYFIPILPLVFYLIASFRKVDLGPLNPIITAAIASLVPLVLVISMQTIYLKHFVGCGEDFYSLAKDTCTRPLGLQTDSPQHTTGILDRPFTQTFTSECDHLSQITFFLAPAAGDAAGNLDIQLRDLTTGQIVFERTTFTHQTIGKWKSFSFSPLPDSWNHTFSLTIAPQNAPISAASLGVISPDAYPQGQLFGVDPAGDLDFQYVCRTGLLYSLKSIVR